MVLPGQKINYINDNNDNKTNNNYLFLIERYLQWQINSTLQLMSLNIKLKSRLIEI